MIFSVINKYELCKSKDEIDYFVASLLMDSKLIKIDKYYLFVKNDKVFNFKYSKEISLNGEKLLKLADILKKIIKINDFQFYYKDIKSLENISYNIIFNYYKNTIKDEIIKYYDRGVSFGFVIRFEELSKENLTNFYNLYYDFAEEKGFNINSISFFEDIILGNKDNFYIVNVSYKEKIIGSIILFKFLDKIILMYGGYDSNYLKKGLKYFVNKSIIDYFEDDNNINEIIFGTGVDEFDINDSVLKFKAKFGDVYPLKKIKGSL